MTDELSIYLTSLNLFRLLNITIITKRKRKQSFTGCSNLFELSENSLSNADATVSCTAEKFQEFETEISNLKSFVSDVMSVIAGKKRGLATKLKTNFALKMFNNHCVCRRRCWLQIHKECGRNSH